MHMYTLYRVKIIVNESSYHYDSDNNQDLFRRKCKCTKPPSEGFWWWPITSSNFSMALLYFQTKQTNQPRSKPCYAINCHLAFPHPSPAEAQPFPWAVAGCTEAMFHIVHLLCGDNPSAEKQTWALPSPTPPTHQFNMYLFRCLQGVFSFLLSNHVLWDCANVTDG